MIFSFWHLLVLLVWHQLQDDKKEHFHYILLFYLRKGNIAAQAAEKLCDVYGEEALKDRQCRNWFDKFRTGRFFT